MVFFNQDKQLENIGNQVLEATWAKFSTLAPNQIALTWVVYDPPV
ncbi:MAG: serine hydrolase, partial [Dolichospermum sp.]